jgi:hypothetical protein
LLGHAAKWINGLRYDSPNLLKALRDKGYTDYGLRVSVKRESKRGATIAETISGDDLDILIAFEAERGDIRIKLLLDIQIFDCVTQHRTSKEQQVVAIYLLKHCSNRCHW